MNNPSSSVIKEFEAFHGTPRRREKPTVKLRNVAIHTQTSLPNPVDLFDALFRHCPYDILANGSELPSLRLACSNLPPTAN